MATKYFYIAPLTATLLLGCSSSGTTPQAESGSSTDQAFLTGNSCETGLATVNVSDQAPPAATTAEQQLSCFEDADTALSGPGVGNTGTGSLNYSGNVKNISAATIDEENYNNQSDVTLLLHDGNTRSLKQSGSNETEYGSETITRIDWGLYNATIAFAAILTQINADTFTGGSFDVIATTANGSIDIPTDTNTAYIVALIRDKNGNGVSDTETEVDFAVSGNINVTGESNNWSVTLDVTLEDGTAVTGVYDGSFHRLPVL